MNSPEAPLFFENPAALNKWFRGHHKKIGEVWIGFYKKASGRPSITWDEAVDAALAYGWIDGIRKSVDEAGYCMRFTPRRAGSKWSVKNTKRFAELKALGRIRKEGQAAFDARNPADTRDYSYEREQARLPVDFEKQFRKNKKAYGFFESQAPSYRKAAVHWVISAKREETRRRRLDTLIEDSAAGRHVAPLRRTPKK